MKLQLAKAELQNWERSETRCILLELSQGMEKICSKATKLAKQCRPEGKIERELEETLKKLSPSMAFYDHGKYAKMIFEDFKKQMNDVVVELYQGLQEIDHDAVNLLKQLTGRERERITSTNIDTCDYYVDVIMADIIMADIDSEMDALFTRSFWFKREFISPVLGFSLGCLAMYVFAFLCAKVVFPLFNPDYKTQETLNFWSCFAIIGMLATFGGTMYTFNKWWKNGEYLALQSRILRPLQWRVTGALAKLHKRIERDVTEIKNTLTSEVQNYIQERTRELQARIALLAGLPGTEPGNG